MNHDSENSDDDDAVLEQFETDSVTRPANKVPRKLKYKEKGYHIQKKSKTGRRWILVSYYRSVSDMRNAYTAATGQKNYWGGYYYRMVFPDGSIVPKGFGD